MSPRGERGRIEAIRRALNRPRSDVLVGIGDDAAVLRASVDDLVLSVDVQVEGVHFRREWLSMTDLGWRAVNAALSDLAAMGAEARAVLLSLVLTDGVRGSRRGTDIDENVDRDLDDLVRGAAEACDAVGTSVVGGNLARGGELSVTTTVIGGGDERRLARDGARPGDAVFVTGVVGASALAVAAFEAGHGDDPRLAPFRRRFRRPQARLDLGRRLRGLATAAADVSDGLISDLQQICRPSGVGARVESALVPTLRDHEEAARIVGADPRRLALAGGEDYELVFTAAPTEEVLALATRIGVVTREPGIVCLDRDGGVLPGSFEGFDHF